MENKSSACDKIRAINRASGIAVGNEAKPVVDRRRDTSGNLLKNKNLESESKTFSRPRSSSRSSLATSTNLTTTKSSVRSSGCSKAEEKPLSRLQHPNNKEITAKSKEVVTEEKQANLTRTNELNANESIVAQAKDDPASNRSVVSSSGNDKVEANQQSEKSLTGPGSNLFSILASVSDVDTSANTFDPFHPTQLSDHHNHNSEAFAGTLEDFGCILVSCVRSCFAVAQHLEQYVEVSATLLVSFLPVETQKKLLRHSAFLGKVAYYLEVALTAVLVLVELSIVMIALSWQAIKPYRPDLLVGMVLSLLVCFFGSFFMTTIAAVEAFFLCGNYKFMKENFSIIVEEVRKAFNATKNLEISSAPEAANSAKIRDDQQVAGLHSDLNKHEDLSTTNSSSTLAGSSELDQLATRDVGDINKSDVPSSVAPLDTMQTIQVLSSVDTAKLTKAVVGVNAGVLAVLMTLRNSFAKTFTLANGMSGSVEQPIITTFQPVLTPLLPKYLQPWTALLLQFVVRSLAVSIAWRLRKLLAAVHSALRGGAFSSFYMLKCLAIFSLSPHQLIDSHLGLRNAQVVLGYTLTALGLWFQFAYQWTTLPFPFGLMLFPFVAIENVLLWLMNSPSLWMIQTVSM